MKLVVAYPRLCWVLAIAAWLVCWLSLPGTLATQTLPDTASVEVIEPKPDPFTLRSRHSIVESHQFWPDSLRRDRLVPVLALTGGGYIACYTALGVMWYRDALGGGFRWFDDWPEWQQIDKLGHAYGAYQISRSYIHLLGRSGISKRQRLFWGGLSGFVAQSPIEIFDGFSADWGASWGDLVANAAGSALAIANEGLWGQQRIQLKFGYWPDPLAQQYPDKLGGSAAEQLMKNYNAQQYWLCTAPADWAPQLRYWPRWLGFGLGYSAQGLIGGYGQEPCSVINAREYRQWYLGFDFRPDMIRTKKGWIRTSLFILSAFRIPLPALRYDRNGLAFSVWGQ